jgi:hypothetical protein
MLNADDSLKSEHVHLEDLTTTNYLGDDRVESVGDTGHGLLKSRFDRLSLLKTVWVFRRVALYCFLVYTLNMVDAWQVRNPLY